MQTAICGPGAGSIGRARGAYEERLMPWAVKWRSENRLDVKREYLAWVACIAMTREDEGPI